MKQAGFSLIVAELAARPPFWGLNQVWTSTDFKEGP